MSRKDKAGIVNLQFKWLWKSEAILKKTFTFCTQRVGRKSKIRPKTQLRVQSNQEKLDYQLDNSALLRSEHWLERKGVCWSSSRDLWDNVTQGNQDLPELIEPKETVYSNISLMLSFAYRMM